MYVCRGRLGETLFLPSPLGELLRADVSSATGVSGFRFWNADSNGKLGLSTRESIGLLVCPSAN